MDIVLGVSMAPSSIQMVVLEGENAEGVTVDEDEFVVTAIDQSKGTSAPDQVISAILGTREAAADAGLQLSAIGVTWTDQVEAAIIGSCQPPATMPAERANRGVPNGPRALGILRGGTSAAASVEPSPRKAARKRGGRKKG